jgi:Putative addiction module component
MAAQYTYDASGEPIGVFIPIHEWNRISEKYPEIVDVPQWEKKVIDQRLDFIKNHPDALIPIEDFFAELDKNDEQ